MGLERIRERPEPVREQPDRTVVRARAQQLSGDSSLTVPALRPVRLGSSVRVLSSLLVGDAAVTVRCGQMLLAAGHTLCGVVTGDDRVAGWAAENRTACLFLAPQAALSRVDVEALIAGAPFDLLLSVHNLRVLPPDLLLLPREMAVNYHDALLPRYAGLHATSWAIMHGEPRHGIVWHRMVRALDAGDLLVERELTLAPDETAWTLNLRCTEAAIEGFGELLAGLTSGKLAPRPQPLAARTYFPGWRRPSPGCVVPWNESAERISAFVRALDFGAADNPMGIPRLVAPGGVFLTPQVRILSARSTAPAGTLLRADADGLVLATATRDISLPVVRSCDGETLPPESVLASLGLAPGDPLAVAAPFPDLLAVRERECRRHEPAWMDALVDLAPLAPPAFAPPGASAAACGLHVASDLPPGAPEDDESVLAAILEVLGEEIGQPFDVAFGAPGLRREITAHGWEGWLAERLPLRVSWHAGVTREELAGELHERLGQLAARGTYAADLPLRFRRLAQAGGEDAVPFGPAVAVDLLAAGETAPVLPARGALRLAIAVDPRQRKLTLQCRSASAPDALNALSQRLISRLDAPRRRPHTATTQRAATVGELFLSQAARTPAATALEWGPERWSYEHLARRVDRLAAVLARRGVRAERLVALRLARLPDLVTAMLAVHQAGGAFMVLDAIEPPTRALRILAENRPFLALADAALQRLAPQLTVLPIGLADGCACLPTGDGNAAQRPPSGRELAYVATTSGSTGAPKGAAVEQCALANYIVAAGREFEFAVGDRILQLGSTAFDLAFEQIFGALCHGATLVGLEQPVLPPPRELLARCGDLGITVLDLPTAVWEQIAIAVAARRWPLPASLRLLVLGGEAATTGAARAWLEASGGARLVNTYGPTEATIVATWWNAPRRAAELPESATLPIGRPVPGVRAVVLDRARLPVAPGEAGELWLGGRGLARGYHRRPDLTAARFARLTLAGSDGSERYYATGDRVRERADGELEFLGRLDRQVKIAGRRVEPGEVEATLRTIPGVEAAAVVASPSPGGRRLRGWVVLARGGEQPDLAAECRQRLPAYLRPDPLVAIDSLPLTPAGKVDFDRLARDSDRRPVVRHDATREPTRSATERRLAAIWSRLLGADAADPIARDTDFFTAGGDSLAAVSLLIAVEDEFGLPLRVEELLRSPSLAGLASELDRRLGAPSRPAATGCRTDLSPQDASPAVVGSQGSPLPAAPTIFCVHGLGGHLLRLVTLARTLSPGRRLVGLQSPGLDDDRPVPKTIEELARTYLTELREQPSPPPYRLAGMSFGGAVAFEMTRLAAPGEIAWIAMFDTEIAELLPEFRPAPLSGLALARDRARRRVGDLLGRLRRARRRWQGGRDDILKPNEYRHFGRVLRANEAALSRYVPGTWSGTVTFFAATARPAALYEEFMRRTGCTLVLVPVPGDHLSMLEPPHVAALAVELEKLS